MPGKGRLARALLDSRLPTGGHRVTDRLGLSYRVADLRDPVAFALLVDGAYRRELLEVVLDLLPERGTYVDVGAGIGAFALPATCRVGQNGRVLAIESSPPIFECLRANAAHNGLANLTTIHASIGSLERAALDQFLIDANVRHVDVMRIGVAGAERHVLESAMTLIERATPPAFVFESTPTGDASQFLMDQGYTLWPLAAYRRRRPPLVGPMTTNATTLIAKRV